MGGWGGGGGGINGTFFFVGRQIYNQGRIFKC